MLTIRKQAAVQKLLAQKISEEKIAIRIGVTRHQVRVLKKQLQTNDNRSDQKILQARLTTMNLLDPYRDQIMEWMEEKGLTVFLVHRKLSDLGESVSLSSVQRYVNKCKKQEVYVPVITAPGEEAQVDYGYLGKFQKEGKLVKVWVFCMVLSHSRYAFYSLSTEQTVQSFIHSHQMAFDFFSGTPAKVLIDNLGAGVMEYEFYQTEFQQQYLAFLDHYGVTPTNARICRGQDKGKVEAGVKYIKNNFLPTVNHSDFEKLATDLQSWNTEVCNRRLHGTTRRIPEAFFLKDEKEQLFSLPKERFKITVREKRKVDAYGHLYFRYNFYSVPFHYAGEELTLVISEKTFDVYNNDVLITTHVIHPGKGTFMSLNCHKPYYKQAKTELYYREEMRRIGVSAERVYELLRSSKPFHWKNMIKGILRLTEIYRITAIDAACLQAMEEGTYDYKHIRQICLTNSLKKQTVETVKIPKGVGGYYHDLSIYDKLVNKAV